MHRSDVLVRWIPRLAWTLAPLAAPAVLITFLGLPTWSRSSSWGPLLVALMSYPLLWCLMWLFVEGPVKTLHRKGRLNLASYTMAALLTGASLGMLGLMGHSSWTSTVGEAMAFLVLCALAALAVALPLWWLGELRRELDDGGQ